MRPMLLILVIVAGLAAAAAVRGSVPFPIGDPVDAQTTYEVWAIDQSDSRPDGGGTLYI